ncbi:hypothetical protein [Yoonia sp. R2-816]|uniref:hypothetical protein n=1 Tax=Yoonia sp. R2-816 TaxID=3342638 RepID=UPI00372C652E
MSMTRRHVLFGLTTSMLSTDVIAQDNVEMMGSMMEHHEHNPHIELTPVTRAAAGDVHRARILAERVRRAIMQYGDVRAAESDGYRRFGPATLPEVHYVNRRLSRAERRGINPETPGSLLYAPQHGGMELAGAMFTAPHGTSLAELNARVPLSQARWHVHVNICLPRPVFNRSAWRQRGADGQPLFGPMGSIATREACEAAGGQFNAVLQGWMVHVYPFRQNPADWWVQRHG